MKNITISGHSDDLIEIEGDWELEIHAYDHAANFLAFSDGTIVAVNYDSEGCWRIYLVEKGTANSDKTFADGPDTDRYSDRLTLTGNLRWVVHSVEYHHAKATP